MARSWLAPWVWVFLSVGVCLLPGLGRLATPSLYADDIERIGHLQEQPMPRLLVTRLNEHLAPVFQAVTWVAWNLAGRRLTAAPRAFTIASYIPFWLSLAALAWVVRRELGPGSRPAALAAVVVFGGSSVYTETVYWFSGSSFVWALLFTLITFGCAGAAGEARGRARALWLAGSALSAWAAPASSAIGLLAGPLGALRLVTAAGSPWGRRVRGAVVGPTVGTLLYFGLCGAFRHQDFLVGSVRRNFDPRYGLKCLVRAPVDVLVPSLLGWRNLDSWLPGAAELGLFVLGLLGTLAWAWRSQRRPLSLGGLWLLLGGYAITYGVRPQADAAWALVGMNRYHLFPHLGLVLILAPALHAALGRLADRPPRALAAVSALAAAVAMLHSPQLARTARFYHFVDQQPTLVALERLDRVCRREGITRAQVLAALDPFRTRWSPYPIGGNGFWMLADSVRTARVPDDRVRAVILGALPVADRERLCTGVEVGPYVGPAEGRPVAFGTLVETFLVRGAGRPEHYRVTDWPSFLERKPYFEYQLGHPTAPPRALVLPVETGGRPLELWWPAPDGRWSEQRRVQWTPEGRRGSKDAAIPLDRIPQWDPVRTPRVRIVVRSAGEVTMGIPRLVR